MELHGELKLFCDSLQRWRDSCIFYFKFDLLLLAGMAATISYFKVEGDEVFILGYNYKVGIYFLLALFIYSIIFEAVLTSKLNSNNLSAQVANKKKQSRLYLMFHFIYFIQVLGHIALILGILAYSSGYVDAYVENQH